MTNDEADDPVSAMKDLARIMQQGIRFQKKKLVIGRSLIASYNTMCEKTDFCNNLHNKVIRNDVTKANALERIDDLVQSIENLGTVLTEFLNEEPDKDERAAMRILYGNQGFDDGVTDQEFLRLKQAKKTQMCRYGSTLM